MPLTEFLTRDLPIGGQFDKKQLLTVAIWVDAVALCIGSSLRNKGLISAPPLSRMPSTVENGKQCLSVSRKGILHLVGFVYVLRTVRAA